MTELTLKFPLTGGGEEHGLNDAGVETFEGKVGGHYLARECAQNAGDAVSEGISTVVLKFELINCPTEQIPCFADLSEKFGACKSFWEKNEKTAAFFSEAVKTSAKQTIAVLKISDYGTTGLLGDDLERTGGWYSLVRSGGVSNKAGGEGGSFGIGKFAPFAASAFRTVFYSTKTTNGAVAFQGVTRLVSHNDDSGEVTQGTGYIGYYNESSHRFQAVRDESSIPDLFSRNDPGTDIHVLAYRDAENWKDDLIYSILQNFWPAIHRNTISFVVGDTQINRDTLKEQFELYKGRDGFDAHVYYQALINPASKRYEEDLPLLGKVELFLLPGGEGFPKRIAMTRRNGMVIENRLFQSRKPYSGYFVCSSDQGNKMLRSMEPPAHDKWEPDRGGKAGKKALKEMTDWIRKCVKEMSPAPTGEALDIPDLAKYLPDDPDQDAEPSSADKNAPGDFSFASKPKQEEIVTRVQPVSAVGRKAPQDDGGKEEDDAGGLGSGYGTPDPKSDGSAGKDGRSQEKGGKGNAGKRPSGIVKPRINLRCALLHTNKYKLIFRTDIEYSGSVRLISVGEDGLEEAIQVETATVPVTGDALTVKKGGIIESLTLSPQSPLVIEVGLSRPQRLALGAAPYEG